MKRMIITLGITVSGFQLAAQGVERYVTGSAGNVAHSEVIQLSFTVGELATGLVQTEGLLLSQGFQSAEMGNNVISEDPSLLVSEFTVYPNPAGNEIYVDFTTRENMEFRLEIYDVTGRVQISMPSFSQDNDRLYNQRIDLGGIKPGIYFLTICTVEGVRVKTSKIRKD